MTMPYDKKLHILVGAALAVVTQILLILGVGFPVMWAGTAVAGLAGFGKELRDWWLNRQAVKRGEPVKHGVEILDVAATALGGAAIDVLALVIWRVA